MDTSHSGGSHRQRSREKAASSALWLWNLAYLYGNIPAARMAVEALTQLGYPTGGMLSLVVRHWTAVPAAHHGWAIHPDRCERRRPPTGTRRSSPPVSATNGP